MQDSLNLKSKLQSILKKKKKTNLTKTTSKKLKSWNLSSDDVTNQNVAWLKTSRNENTILIKQDNVVVFVILDKRHLIEKCLNILESGQSLKLPKDPTEIIRIKNATHFTENK